MKCPALTLSLLLAACRTPGPEQQALLELPGLVDELRAAVIEELGADHSDGEYQLAWSEDLVAWAGIARFPAGPALVVREDWGLLSPAWKRLSIAHELVHLHGPRPAGRFNMVWNTAVMFGNALKTWRTTERIDC